ncbi:MAG: hypothetical protein K0Q59_5736 [Paenibacillus sp.]|nr:hypothetical protein [Paenibacillus sp.]
MGLGFDFGRSYNGFRRCASNDNRQRREKSTAAFRCCRYGVYSACTAAGHIQLVDIWKRFYKTMDASYIAAETGCPINFDLRFREIDGGIAPDCVFQK